MILQIRTDKGRVIFEIKDLTIDDLDLDWAKTLEAITSAIAQHAGQDFEKIEL